jgi:hypothetical protein
MSKRKYNCPKCNSNEFVTEPNQYDILVFTENGFEIQETEPINDYKIFCRDCFAEMDISKSVSMKKVCAVRKKRVPSKRNPPKDGSK